MKRLRIYRNGSFDEDSVVVLDFTTVPGDALTDAEQEAFAMSFSDAVGEAESIEEAYELYPQLCGFEPWIWGESGGWKPQGMNRAWLLKGQKSAAKTELLAYVRTFIDTYHHCLSPDEIRDMLEQALTAASNQPRP